MMVSMETLLRRTGTWVHSGRVRNAAAGAAYFGGGFVLSGLKIWGQMQPAAMGLAAVSGWKSCVAAVGSAAGYRYFWGTAGNLGILWTVGALLLALLMPLTERGSGKRTVPVGCMCLTAGTGLALQAVGGGSITPGLFVLRILISGGCTLVSREALASRDRVSRWVGAGVLVMALAQTLPWLARMLSGAAAAMLPLPAAGIVGMGTDLGAGGSISMAAVACGAFFLQRLWPRDSRKRMAAPALACGGLMALEKTWDPGLLLAVSLGGAAGGLVPWKYTVVPRRSRVGAAQVRLEQTAGVLTRFQRQLLEYVPPAPDIPGIAEQLRRSTCGACPSSQDCREQERMDESLLRSEAAFTCRKSNAAAEVHRSREQLRRLKASRAKQEEYRMALVQQYGFLSDALHDLSDRLPERERRCRPRFRVRVSARSRSRELADGDRVSAFPGTDCRYYVVLCDGMGTGMGAAEESRRTVELIRQMLTAGLAPETVLGSVNSQLALTDRGGAVTVDLAEIRLDSGRAMLYKWGAGPSWLLKRRRGMQIGASGPPPGLGVTTGRETTSRCSLAGGETLLMLSDGIPADNLSAWIALSDSLDPGPLAREILDSTHTSDDATAVVVRLESKTVG